MKVSVIGHIYFLVSFPTVMYPFFKVSTPASISTSISISSVLLIYKK